MGTDDKLATFKIAPDVWEAFKQKAETDGFSASALLKTFIGQYLDGSLDPRQESSRLAIEPNIETIEPLIETRIEAALEPMRSRLAAIESEMGKLAA